MARPGFVRSLGTIFLGVLTYIVIQSTIDAAPPCSFVSTIGVCDLQRNVSEVALSRQNEIIKYINSTILGITMVTTKTECVEALQRVFCRKHFTSCSKTNNTSEQRQQECEAVEGNCSELLAKTYANTTCPSISAYTGNLCVGLNVTKDSYCPAGEVYKILAKDVSTFLEQAGQGKKGFIRLLGNDLESCRKIYRRVHCKSFAQSCSTYNKMTKEKCEQDLACLNSNSTVNKTELCSKFPNEKLSPMTMGFSTPTKTTTTTIISPTKKLPTTTIPKLPDKIVASSQTTKTRIPVKLNQTASHTNAVISVKNTTISITSPPTKTAPTSNTVTPNKIAIITIILTTTKRTLTAVTVRRKPTATNSETSIARIITTSTKTVLATISVTATKASLTTTTRGMTPNKTLIVNNIVTPAKTALTNVTVPLNNLALTTVMSGYFSNEATASNTLLSTKTPSHTINTTSITVNNITLATKIITPTTTPKQPVIPNIATSITAIVTPNKTISAITVPINKTAMTNTAFTKITSSSDTILPTKTPSKNIMVASNTTVPTTVTEIPIKAVQSTNIVTLIKTVPTNITVTITKIPTSIISAAPTKTARPTMAITSTYSFAISTFSITDPITTDSPTTIHHQNSHSPSKSPPSGLATTAVTTPSLANTTKTMVTFKLGNTKYIGSYENKTSPSYILLSKDVTNALNKAYAGLTGFVAVEILGLTCHNEVFVKHNIITRQSEVKPGMEIIKDKLTTANTAGFLKDKIIIPTIKETCETEAKHKHDENNWVYMIIFVCVTALLLLAMVLCNQST